MGVIFQDAFTEAGANKNLDVHSVDTGTGWTLSEQTGTATIQARATQDRARASGGDTENRTIYTGSPASSVDNYDIEWTVGVTATALTTSPSFAVARWTDSSNYYSAGVYGSNANPDARIFKKVAGTVTAIDSGGANIDIAAGHKLKLSVRTGTLELFQDTGSGYVSVIGPVSDSDLTSIGTYGYGLGNTWDATDDVSAVWEIDDFTVTEIAPGGGGRIMSSLAAAGGLAGSGGIAGTGGGLAG